MRNNVASTPFVLFSSMWEDSTFADGQKRAGEVRKYLASDNIPFKELQLRAFAVGGADDYAPVFLLDSADSEVARQLARDSSQPGYIEVDAFMVGQRVSLVTGEKEAFVGALVEVEKRRLSRADSYLLEVKETGNRYFVWK